MAQKITQGPALGGTISVAISAAGAGVNALVAAVPGRRIRVTQLVLVADGAVTVELRSAATARTGAMSFAANGGVVWPFNERGWVTTEINEALNANLGGAVGIRGVLQYDLIP